MKTLLARISVEGLRGVRGNFRDDFKKILAGKFCIRQVRYQYQGDEWWDTLLHTPQGGIRLVRIRQEYQ